MKFFQKFPDLLFYLVLAFVTFGWPFVGYPLTDADCLHWIGKAVQVAHSHHFLSFPSDQAHGPLLVWTAAMGLAVFPDSWFVVGLFNALMGVLAVGLAYWFALRHFNSVKIAQTSAFLLAVTIAPVYLSHTPMYDWPTAVLSFGFMGFYWAWVREKRGLDFGLALLLLALASLSRFSISLGLASVFFAAVNVLFWRSWKAFFNDAGIIAVAILAANGPWLWVQFHTYGTPFWSMFVYDNIGRYIREPGDSHVYHDYYGFLLYVLVGVLPFSPHVIASFCKRSFVQELKKNRHLVAVLAMWLPCLIVFSFSGHVKLGRYIAYVFPGMLLQLAIQWNHHDWAQSTYRKHVRWGLGGILGVLVVALTVVALQFKAETLSSPIWVGAVIGLVLGVLAVALKFSFQETPNLKRYALVFSLLYLVFWSVTAWAMTTASFLMPIRDALKNETGVGF